MAATWVTPDSPEERRDKMNRMSSPPTPGGGCFRLLAPIPVVALFMAVLFRKARK